jgi:hypothetical protein
MMHGTLLQIGAAKGMPTTIVEYVGVHEMDFLRVTGLGPGTLTSASESHIKSML